MMMSWTYPCRPRAALLLCQLFPFFWFLQSAGWYWCPFTRHITGNSLVGRRVSTSNQLCPLYRKSESRIPTIAPFRRLSFPPFCKAEHKVENHIQAGTHMCLVSCGLSLGNVQVFKGFWIVRASALGFGWRARSWKMKSASIQKNLDRERKKKQVAK